MPMLRVGTVNEHSSRRVRFYIYDEDGAAVPFSALSSATLTFYNKGTYAPGSSPVIGIINSRDGQNVLNANNVTIHATSGLVTWAMQKGPTGDNPIIVPRRQVERHIAEFVFVAGDAEINQDCEVIVRNLGKSR